MIVGFLIVIAVVGILMYILLIQRAVPGAVEQRFGVYEALPDDVGRWKTDLESESGRAAQKRGEKREVRLYHNPNAENKLIRQVRYRNALNEIVRVEPDEVLKRKRVRS